MNLKSHKALKILRLDLKHLRAKLDFRMFFRPKLSNPGIVVTWQVLTCYNEQQVNVEDIHLTREMIEQYQREQGTVMDVSSS